MYKVTNKKDDVRKFRDRHTGKDVHVNPGKSVLTNRPPQPSEVFEVEVAEEKKEEKEEKKKKTTKKEDDKL